MIKKPLIYISNSFNPYENLAAEKILFDNVKADEYILYLWQNKNTVVIGKNQNAYSECRCALLEKDGGYLARRLSGGGAVFHDLGNLNFTFISHTEIYNLSRNMNIIALACKKAGIETELSGRNDILAEGRKFSGNAFYNSKGKTYHHGTIMINTDTEKMQKYLSPSKAKLEAKGVKSVRSRVVNLIELNPELSCNKMKDFMTEAFEEVCGIKAEYITKTENIEPVAAQFACRDHLYNLQPPFSLSFEKRFEWGSIDIRLRVENGIIKSTAVYTDSMDWTLADKIQLALTDCDFEIGAVKTQIEKHLETYVAKDILSLIQKGM